MNYLPLLIVFLISCQNKSEKEPVYDEIIGENSKTSNSINIEEINYTNYKDYLGESDRKLKIDPENYEFNFVKLTALWYSGDTCAFCNQLEFVKNLETIPEEETNLRIENDVKESCEHCKTKN